MKIEEFHEVVLIFRKVMCNKESSVDLVERALAEVACAYLHTDDDDAADALVIYESCSSEWERRKEMMGVIA